MNGWFGLSIEERRLLCEKAGARLGIAAASVEKDFWACKDAAETIVVLRAGTQTDGAMEGALGFAIIAQLQQRQTQRVVVVGVFRRGPDRAPEEIAGCGMISATLNEAAKHIRKKLWRC